MKKPYEIPPPGKIHARRVQTFEEIIQRLRDNRDNFLSENQKILLEFIRDAKLGKTNLKRAKKAVQEKRLLKYISTFKLLENFVNKPFLKVEPEEIEDYILALQDGRITHGKNKKPYKNSTLVNLKKVYQKFYRYYLGNELEFQKLVGWFDTHEELPEFTAIKHSEIETMLTLMISTKSELLVRKKALMMLLFDSGARVEELMNVRIENLEMNDGIYYIRIGISKTFNRTIPVPYATSYLNDWLDIHPYRDKKLAPLFPMSYDQIRKTVKSAGKAINVNITPHDLRHSSATYWCQHLSHAEMCVRFGWGLNSRMPQRYIDRSGISQNKVIQVFKSAQEKAQNEEKMMIYMKIQEMVQKFDKIEKFFPEESKEIKKIIEIVERTN